MVPMSLLIGILGYCSFKSYQNDLKENRDKYSGFEGDGTEGGEEELDNNFARM